MLPLRSRLAVSSLILLVAVTLSLPHAAHALDGLDPNDPASVAAFFAPNSSNWNNAGPLFMQLRMNQLDKVDGVTKTFEADFYLMLAFPMIGLRIENLTAFTQQLATTSAAAAKLFGDPTKPVPYSALPPSMIPPEMDMSAIDFIFENSNDFEMLTSSDFVWPGDPEWMLPSLQDYPNDVMYFMPNTFVYFLRYRRYKATFQASLPLHDFPFDKQDVNIKVHMERPKEILKLVPVQHDFVDGMGGLLQWKLDDHKTEYYDKRFSGIPEVFSGLQFQISLTRLPNYYYLKIISGICMIVFMNFLLFALPIEDSNRIAVSATLFLAIVAYLFLVSNDVPKVAYATRLDNFILLSMMDIFLSTILFQITLTVNRIALKRQAEADEEWEMLQGAAANLEIVASSTSSSHARKRYVKESPKPIVVEVGRRDSKGDGDSNNSNGGDGDAAVVGLDGFVKETPKNEQREDEAGGRPRDQWFDKWVVHSSANDMAQAFVVVSMFFVGAPLILWG